MAALAAPPATLTIERFVEMTADRRPYPEWVDGRIEERPVPDYLHGYVQSKASHLVFATGTLSAGTEVHSRVAYNYRLPDVSIWATLPGERYPSSAPLATLEVLSPNQNMTKMLKKCAEYERWGVKHVWLVDPEERALLLIATGDCRKSRRLKFRNINSGSRWRTYCPNSNPPILDPLPQLVRLKHDAARR